MKKVLIFCMALSFACASMAQETDLMKKKDISTRDLIDALTPKQNPKSTQAEQPAEQSSEPRMRKFIVQKEAPMKKPKEIAQIPTSALILITFEVDSAVLQANSKKIVDKIAGAFKSDALSQHRFIIEGHADPSGEPLRNERLSEDRANAVKQYLIKNHHIDAARLVAVGKGANELLNSENPTAPENRRVKIVTVVGNDATSQQ